MAIRLFSWLGWEPDSTEGSKPEHTIGRRSATAHLFEKEQPGTERQPEVATSADEFNPYNTGKFDRSASWERISKSQR